MSDSFGFGEPAKKWSEHELHQPSPHRGGGRGRDNVALTRGMIGAVVGLLALAMFIVVFVVMKSGGESAAEAEETAVAQIGVAQDTQAQVDLQTAYQTAMTLYESGDGGATGLPSFANITAADLAKAEPSLMFTDGASTGPDVISVKGSGSEWGAAALSSSGTCLWVHLSSGAVTFGSGTPCTGSAAMAADRSSW